MELALTILLFVALVATAADHCTGAAPVRRCHVVRGFQPAVSPAVCVDGCG